MLPHTLARTLVVLVAEVVVTTDVVGRGPLDFGVGVKKAYQCGIGGQVGLIAEEAGVGGKDAPQGGWVVLQEPGKFVAGAVGVGLLDGDGRGGGNRDGVSGRLGPG